MIRLKRKEKAVKPLCLLIAFILTVLTILCSCSEISYGQTVSSKHNDSLTVNVLDVKQGDAIFIELPGERCMLIDAGESEYGSKVTGFIKQAGYQKIDYLVATHPHADHIGGMKQVIESFDIGRVYMPKVSANTKTYENLLKAIEAKELKITPAKAGINILNTEELNIDILAPHSGSYDELNNYSAVIKITFGSVRFLFMGDAEEESENKITADVGADLVKIGHHGSKTSSSKEFVNRVGAKTAVISVAEINDYNLPSDKIINRWEKSGAQVFTTMDYGNIIACSDGKNLNINGKNITLTDKPDNGSKAVECRWILNKNSKKIHSENCPSAENISAKNKEYSTQSIEQLMAQGYTPCKSCNPHN